MTITTTNCGAVKSLRRMCGVLSVIKNSNRLDDHLGKDTMAAYNRVIADCEFLAGDLERQASFRDSLSDHVGHKFTVVMAYDKELEKIQVLLGCDTDHTLIAVEPIPKLPSSRVHTNPELEAKQ